MKAVIDFFGRKPNFALYLLNKITEHENLNIKRTYPNTRSIPQR